jgi:membrane-associated phospholipid phosphatase
MIRLPGVLRLNRIYAALSMLILSALFGGIFLPGASAQSGGAIHQEAKFASGTGNVIFLAGAVALPMLSHEADGKSEAIRSVDSLGTSLAIVEILKDTTREKRPDTNTHDSFPSGHADAAFAAATIESRFYPKQAGWWYAGATLISASRLQLNRHHLQDVLVGAGLGYGTSVLELSQRHGLILGPFITPQGSGVTVSIGL